MKPKDLITVAGFGLLVLGCYWHYPPLAAIVPGGLLLAVGLAAHFIGARK